MNNIHKIKPLSAMIAVAMLLASCASSKGIESSARLRAPTDYETSASLPAQQGQWPDMSWARDIGGQPLQTLVDEALAGNPGLQIAAARIASAKAMTEAAHAATGPSIDASYKTTWQRFTENGIIPPPYGGMYTSENDLTANFSYDFDFWGRHDADLRAALAESKVAQAEQYAARLALTTSITRAWLHLALQHAMLDLSRQQLAAREKIDELTRLRIKAGLDTQAEREQSLQQSEVLRAEQAQLSEAIALTRNQIAALMGQGPDRGQRIERPILPEDTPLALPSDLPLDLLGRRADIVAARWRVEAAQQDIDSAKAQFYPNINLMAFAGFSSLGLSDLLKSGSRVVGIGPAVRVPIFGGGALRAQLKGKVATYDAAVASYNQTLTEALREVADRAQSMHATHEQKEHRHAATEAAAHALELARRREHTGTTSMLPVLATETAWLAQRRAELDSYARQLDAKVGLINALGGGFDADAQGLSSPASLSSNNSTGKTAS